MRKPQKRSLQIFRKVSGVFQLNFNGLKIVLSLSRGQGNFQGLEASRPRPSPRTSKCVLEDVLEAKDVLEDSTSGQLLHAINAFYGVNWSFLVTERKWQAIKTFHLGVEIKQGYVLFLLFFLFT